MKLSNVITSAQDRTTKLTNQFRTTDIGVFGIDISRIDSDVTFQWLVAAVLLGSGLPRRQAVTQYRALEQAGLTTPERISAAGLRGIYTALQGDAVWDTTRFASVLVAVASVLIIRYEGDLNRLHFFAEGAQDLERRLLSLSSRLPLTAVHIFLRGLRGIWEKAEPPFTPAARMAYTALFSCYYQDYESPGDLERHLEEGYFGDVTPYAFEAALEQLGERYCQRHRCAACPFRGDCTMNRTTERRDE